MPPGRVRRTERRGGVPPAGSPLPWSVNTKPHFRGLAQWREVDMTTTTTVPIPAPVKPEAHTINVG
jgi:hypothetical protein